VIIDHVQEEFAQACADNFISIDPKLNCQALAVIWVEYEIITKSGLCESAMNASIQVMDDPGTAIGESFGVQRCCQSNRARGDSDDVW